MTNDKFFTVKEVAKELKLSEKTIRNLINENAIETTRVSDRSIRIRNSDLENYLENKRHK